MQDLFAVTHLRSSARPGSGLSRVEALWLLLLGVVVTAVILWTLGRELDRARARHARDLMDYLAGHLQLALGPQLEGWPEGVSLLYGPGDPPVPLGGEGQRQLREVLPETVFLPADPWGRAFLVEQQADGPVLLCGGPDGDPSTAEATAEDMRRPLRTDAGG